MAIKFIQNDPVSKFENEALGFGNFIEILISSIENTTPPFVFGILGDWGTGKTSVLRLIQTELKSNFEEKNANFYPIWFNPWKYENESNIMYPLLHAINGAFESRFHHSSIERKKFEKSFQEVAATSALALADLGLRVTTKQLAGEALSLEDIAKQYREIKSKPEIISGILQNWADEVSKINSAFSELLHQFAVKLAEIKHRNDAEKIKFVILIDDLDRVLPDVSILILEGIKNYLSVENCIFILALNPEVVYQGIKVKYKGAEISGSEYLEKIINFSFYVPEPVLENIASFTSAQAEQRIDPKANWELQIEQFGLTIDNCKFNNPRKILRIIPRFLQFLVAFSEDIKSYSIPLITRLLIISEYYPSMYEITSNQETSAAILQLLDRKITAEEFEKNYGVNVTGKLQKFRKMRMLFDIDRIDGFHELLIHLDAISQINPQKFK